MFPPVRLPPASVRFFFVCRFVCACADVSGLKAEDLSYKSTVSFLEEELKTGW